MNPNFNKRNRNNEKAQNIMDCQNRLYTWKKNVVEIIRRVAQDSNVLKKQFVAAHVCGVYFTDGFGVTKYYASELVFVKFNFQNGVTKTLTLFPDSLKISIGYRESLYEDLDEAVGWRPDQFRCNHSIHDCIKLIREFFVGNFDPIYIFDKDIAEEITMALYYMYAEVGEQCPWIHSLEDVGKHCTIYQLDQLIAELINGKVMEKFTCVDVRNKCRELNKNTSCDKCERHTDYGTLQQCAHQLVIKNLYSSFSLMYPHFKSTISNLKDIVSNDYFKAMTYDALQINQSQNKYQDNTWNTHGFEQLNVEDVINGFGTIAIQQMPERPIDRVFMGRGCPLPSNKNVRPAPGTMTRQKLKLPNVIC